MQLLRGEKHLQGLRPADEARQTLGASPAGDETEGRTTMAEDGVGRGDAALAGECQIQSPTHAVAVNGSDGRGGEVDYSIHQALSHVGEAERLGAVQFGDFMEVSAGGEEMDVAGND